MEVEFLSRFNKDIENVEPRVKKAILKVIAKQNIQNLLQEFGIARSYTGIRMHTGFELEIKELGFLLKRILFNLQGLFIERIFIKFSLSHLNI